MAYSIGTDIGGTFTDCVIVDDEGRLGMGKAPSTPPNFAAGFFAAVEDACERLGRRPAEVLGTAKTLVHATTAGSNAVVERTGARVGLITTKGHGDAVLVMRGGGRVKGLGVSALLDIPSTRKPEPIVDRERIFEVPERVDSFGEVVVELDEQALREAVQALIEAPVDAIAICFLWSFLNPAHEVRAKQIVEEVAPGTFVTTSHEVAPQVGEYNRTVATVMNAYLGPLLLNYAGEIMSEANRREYRNPVLFAQCVGGATPVEEITRVPLMTLDSGPVSGVVAAQFLGERCGYRDVITADMGGTTLDVAVIADGVPTRRNTTIVNQYEMFLPMLGVESIGAGGGSIAWLDEASGTMKVGPQSAGAVPGPVCYGRGGTEPTVTDANLILGIINSETSLAGDTRLDHAAAYAALEQLGSRIGRSAEQAAAGIVEIVDHAMAEQIRRMTVSRGHDPRDFALFAFGGAAGAHAASFAAELEVPRVIVPLGDLASVLSAMGTVSSDVAHVYESSVRHVEPYDMDAVRAQLAEHAERAVAQLGAEGFEPEEIELAPHALMKYGAQVYDLEIRFEPDDTAEQLIARFEDEYARQFGSDAGYRPAGIQIIRLRTYARGKLPRPAVARREAGGGVAPRPIDERDVWWRALGEAVRTPVFDAALLDALGSSTLPGPAIVDLPDTTIAIRPGDQVGADEFGNLVIEVGG